MKRARKEEDGSSSSSSAAREQQRKEDEESRGLVLGKRVHPHVSGRVQYLFSSTGNAAVRREPKKAVIFDAGEQTIGRQVVGEQSGGGGNNEVGGAI